MKKATPNRNFYVVIKPFDYYDKEYFCNRNRMTEKGRAVNPYFLEKPSEKAEHTLEEAQETIAFLNLAYSNKQFRTVSKQGLSNEKETYKQ